MTPLVYTETADNFKNVFNADSMLRLALDYAAGNVLFDEGGTGIRCAVFPLKRADKRPYTEHGWMDASTDPATIRAWWAKWPDAMIGIATGLTGLAVIDCDAHKPEFKRRSQRFMRRVESFGTREAQTPSGGAHFLFNAGGDRWSIKNKTFPAAVDVRAKGGYIVAAGSVRDDGTPYTWRNDAPVRNVPMLLAHMLDRAQKATGRAHKPRTTPTDYKPRQQDGSDIVDAVRRTWSTLDVFRHHGLANDISDERGGGVRLHGHGGLIVNADNVQWYCHSDQVGGDALDAWAWCTRGRRIDRSDASAFIDVVREMAAAAGIALHIGEFNKDNSPDIPALKLWIKTHSFAPYVNAKRYRTDSTDTKVADAILDLIALSPFGMAKAGKDRLAKLAGLGSGNTASAAVDRLAGWLFDVGTDPETHCMTFRVHARIAQIDPYVYDGQKHRGQCTQNELDEYTARKADDAWQTGTSYTVKRWAKEMAEGNTTWRQWILDNTTAGLGESALRIVDALARVGDMTVDELADETDKSKGTIGRAARRLRLLGVLEAERETSRHPYVYGLAAEWAHTVDELVPSLRTYQMADGREERRVKKAQLWAARQAELGETEEIRTAAHRKQSKLTVKRQELLARLHPTVPDEVIADVAANVPYKQWVQQRAGQRISKQELQTMLMTLAANLLAYCDETGRITDRNRMMADMRLAGWEDADIWAAMRPTMLQQARTLVQI